MIDIYTLITCGLIVMLTNIIYHMINFIGSSKHRSKSVYCISVMSIWFMIVVTVLLTNNYTPIFGKYNIQSSISLISLGAIICTMVSIMADIRIKSRFKFKLTDYAIITRCLVYIFTIVNILTILK